MTGEAPTAVGEVEDRTGEELLAKGLIAAAEVLLEGEVPTQNPLNTELGRYASVLHVPRLYQMKLLGHVPVVAPRAKFPVFSKGVLEDSAKPIQHLVGALEYRGLRRSFVDLHTFWSQDRTGVRVKELQELDGSESILPDDKEEVTMIGGPIYQVTCTRRRDDSALSQPHELFIFNEQGILLHRKPRGLKTDMTSFERCQQWLVGVNPDFEESEPEQPN